MRKGECCARPRVGAVAARVGRILCCLLAVVCPAFVASAGAGDDALLRLKAASFDPALGIPDLKDRVPAGPTLPLRTPRAAAQIVQFAGPVTAAVQVDLASRGFDVLDFVPENALIVRPRTGVSAGALTSLPGVRAVTPYAAGLKVSTELAGLLRANTTAPEAPSTVRLNVFLFDDGDIDFLAQSAPKTVATARLEYVRGEAPRRLAFSAPMTGLRDLVGALAQHPEVIFIDVAHPNQLHNDNSAWIGQSYDRVNGPFEAQAPDPKPYSLTGTVWNHGITGAGQVIGVADTRLEHEMCFYNDPAHPVVKQEINPPGPLTVDPNHRKILAYNNVVGGADLPPYPTWRHGTHTAGSALGDSSACLSTPANAGHDTGDGMAPNAKLVYLDMYLGVNTSNCTDFICAFCSVADILQQEYGAGARISTNSWGNDDSEGGAADAIVWSNPEMLVFFSAGNDGAGGYSVLGTAGAKNVLGIGAAENYDTSHHDSFGSLDPENMTAFSSLGPAWDGRIKPDIVAPGQPVVSAMLPVTRITDATDPRCDPTNPNVCFPSFGGCYVTDPNGLCAVGKLSGTSMSGPTAAGLGALARQYFADGFYPSGSANPVDARNPSAALVKAVLINGARNMTGRVLRWMGQNVQRVDFGQLPDAPSNRQGWGRVVLDDALYFTGDGRRLLAVDVPSVAGSGLATGDNALYKVEVTSAAAPLKITLVWTDPPASQAALKSLRNDLDLTVTAPDGTIYKGNQWTPDDVAVPNDKRSAPNPTGRDDLNNVEGVLIPSPALGVYKIEVRGYGVPGYQSLYTQGYALVATGEFTGQGSYCGTIPLPPQNFAASVVRWDDVLLTWTEAPGATSYEIVRNTNGCAPPNTPGVVFTSPPSGSYHDRTTQPSMTYYYTVRALLSPAGCKTAASECRTVNTPPPPTLQFVTPDLGPNNDATPITLTGRNFAATPRVFLGTASQPEKYELTPVTFVSATEVRATVPVNLQNGSYNVKLVNPDTLTGTVANGYSIGSPIQYMTMYATSDNSDYYGVDHVAVINLEQSALQTPVNLTAYDDPVDVAVNRAVGKGVIGLYGAGPSGEQGRVAILSLYSNTTTRTIPVPNTRTDQRPVAVAIHPSGNPAYVLTAPRYGPAPKLELSSLDLNTYSFTKTITLGSSDVDATSVSRWDVEVAPNGSYLCTTDSLRDVVSIVRTLDLVETARIPVGDGPVGVAISPDSSRIYVMNYLDDTISVVNAASQTVVDVIDVSYQPNPAWTTRPEHAAVSPDGTKLYVVFFNGWGSTLWQVATVDLATKQMMQKLLMGRQLEKALYVRTLNKLYTLGVLAEVVRHTPATLQIEWRQAFDGHSRGFDYVEPVPLTIASVAPNASCKTGGLRVTITGQAFQGEIRDDAGNVIQQRTRVFFGGVEATNVTLVNSTTLSVVTPPHAPGVVNVDVKNPNGRSATLVGGFRYKNCVTIP